MLVTIDESLCIGCGLCEEVAPDIFKIGDYHAGILRQPQTEEEILMAKIALRDCPTGALRIDQPARGT